jgi:hypothetical protein
MIAYRSSVKGLFARSIVLLLRTNGKPFLEVKSRKLGSSPKSQGKAY